ncbi:MAG TPA: hypothetical protein VLE46_08035 [Nitrospira sp.]|nr:hypothetical protein [Nitrospira sp.]
MRSDGLLTVAWIERTTRGVDVRHAIPMEGIKAGWLSHLDLTLCSQPIVQIAAIMAST